MVYLDFAASTPLDPRVLEAMMPWLTAEYGNPSSLHAPGLAAKNAVEEARLVVAECLGAHADEIFFTSGTTESVNLALNGHHHIVYATTEHDATRSSAHHAPASTSIPVGHDGMWREEDILQALDDQTIIGPHTAMVAVSWVNNEIGAVYPIHHLATMLEKQKKETRVYLHIDAAQAFNYCEIDLERTPIHALSFGSSKIYGPKGVGVLYLRRGTPRSPLFFGGKQQSGLRPGTENVAGIVGLAEACRLAVFQRTQHASHVRALSDAFVETLESLGVEYTRNGPAHAQERCAHIVNLTFPGIHAEELLLRLDAHGVYCSAASACRSGSGPSDTLQAIGLSPAQIEQTLRFSFGHPLTTEDVIKAATLTAQTIQTMLKNIYALQNHR